MATMVAEPYVNHIPTMTGGIGFESLRHFYAHHFIGVNPPDLELPSRLLSREVHAGHVGEPDQAQCRRLRMPLVAIRLFVSPRRVQSHLTHVYTKLGLSSRVQLAQEAACHA
jgi:hypothetical protein